MGGTPAVTAHPPTVQRRTEAVNLVVEKTRRHTGSGVSPTTGFAFSSQPIEADLLRGPTMRNSEEPAIRRRWAAGRGWPACWGNGGRRGWRRHSPGLGYSWRSVGRSSSRRRQRDGRPPRIRRHFSPWCPAGSTSSLPGRLSTATDRVCKIAMREEGAPIIAVPALRERSAK